MKVRRESHETAFSLIEVVIALGVIGFAIVGILGLLPTGLQTSRSSQSDTRAAQIAQSVFSSLVSQAQTQFSQERLQLDSTNTIPFDLSQSETKSFYADNNGDLVSAAATATYLVTAKTNNNPAGFDQGYANQVTLTVSWPAVASLSNQTKRDFVRVISRY